MRHFVLSWIMLLWVGNFSYAQTGNNGIYIGNDTSICGGANLALHATLNVLSNVSSNGINLSDDVYSQVIPIGFTFNFYGNNYSQCLISTNGYITFNTASSGGYSPWSINAPIPSSLDPTNAIMGPWQDVNPGAGGSIVYASFGTAPNRKFVVQWDNPMFSCTNLCFGNQIILYESSNIIETHIGNKPICSSWNTGKAIHGLQNASGTLATVVPGRNANMQWSTTMEGKRFSPSGGNYTISSIPYTPIFLGLANNSVISWSIAGGAALGTGANINVSPTQTTSYVAAVSSVTCGGTAQSSSFTYYDTLVVTISDPVVTTYSQNADCATGAGGMVWATVTGAAPPYNFIWNTNPPTNNDTVFNANVGTYSVTLTDASGCVASGSATITQQGSLITAVVFTTDLLCNGVPTGSLQVEASGTNGPYIYVLGNDTSYTGIFSNLPAGVHNVQAFDAIGCGAVQQVTLNQPAAPLTLTQNTHVNVSCFNLNNGSATFAASGGTPPYNYSSGVTNNTNGTFNNLTAGPYVFSVSDGNGCYLTILDTITQPQKLEAFVASSTNILCYGQSNGSATAMASGGEVPYSYTWNSIPVQNNAQALMLSQGTYQVVVSDNNSCTASANIQITQPDSIAVTLNSEISLCQTYDTTLIAYASGGTGQINFNWSPGNSNTSSLIVAPMSNTTYTVTATDINGCSKSKLTNVLVFGSPEVSFTKNSSKGCPAFCPTFTDLTLSPAGSINSFREWDFGDGQIVRNDSVADHCYNVPGNYSVTLTVVTDKGCKKSLTRDSYIEVYPNPNAAFVTNPVVTDIMNPNVEITNLTTEGSTYSWNFGDSDSLFTELNPKHIYRDTGTYTIRLISVSNQGCIDSTKAFVTINPYYTFYMPNSFTPNGDGLNDIFEVNGNYIKECQMEIFDRWGKIIFTQAGTYKVSWDGANTPQGVYVYKLKIKDTMDMPYEYIGQVVLIK